MTKSKADLVAVLTSLGQLQPSSASTQADLIQPTLTAFAGNRTSNVLVSPGEIPGEGTRSLLLTHDFSFDTGIVNPALGATATTLSFSSPLINGPGPDLVMFEINFVSPDDFLMQVDGMVIEFLASSYGPELATNSYQIYSNDRGVPTNITQLEFDPYSSTLSVGAEEVFGIAIDLDDFGVAPLGMVSTVHFGSVGEAEDIGRNTSFDPVLLMGINSVVVPEPSTFSLAAVCLFGIALRRKRTAA